VQTATWRPTQSRGAPAPPTAGITTPPDRHLARRKHRRSRGSFQASGAWTTQRNGRSVSRKPLVTSRISSGSRSVRRATRRHGLDQSRCWRAFGWSTETAAEDVVEGEGRGRGTRRGRGSRAGVRRHREVFPMQIWWTRWV
jgi:hypothetical protein